MLRSLVGSEMCIRDSNRVIESNTFLTIDKILNSLFIEKKINCLIQIGANDGLRFDILTSAVSNI